MRHGLSGQLLWWFASHLTAHYIPKSDYRTAKVSGTGRVKLATPGNSIVDTSLPPTAYLASLSNKQPGEQPLDNESAGPSTETVSLRKESSLMTKRTTKKTESQKPRLNAKQKAQMRKIEKDAAINLSATLAVLEELTEDCFIRKAIENAITQQCEHYRISPAKHGDDNFTSTLESILKFGPVIDDVAAKHEAQEEAERTLLTTEQLERVAERLASDYECSEKGIARLVGFFGYLATLSGNSYRKSMHPDNVDDVVAVVNQSIYGRVSGDAARQFEKKALADLTRGFGTTK